MRKLLKRFEDLMVAVTFAEAAEYDEAHRLAGGHDDQQESQVSLHPVKNQTLLERAGK